jgi:hypothetical protein
MIGRATLADDERIVRLACWGRSPCQITARLRRAIGKPGSIRKLGASRICRATEERPRPWRHFGGKAHTVNVFVAEARRPARVALIEDAREL